MKIDPQELAQATNVTAALEAMRKGPTVFYRKEPDGNFSICRYEPREFDGELGQSRLNHAGILIQNGVLYVRRDKPWYAL
jgi:hypothetical protein